MADVDRNGIITYADFYSVRNGMHFASPCKRYVLLLVYPGFYVVYARLNIHTLECGTIMHIGHTTLNWML